MPIRMAIRLPRIACASIMILVVLDDRSRRTASASECAGAAIRTS
jgi:hypothetical protein